MNRSESKYFHTAERMDEALLSLLEKKELSYITVKEICEKAGVNRSTFYLHYENIGDLLAECAEYMNRRFLSYMKQDAQDFIGKLPSCQPDEMYLITPEYLTPYLCYVRENRYLMLAALNHAPLLQLDHAYAALFQHVFTPILSRFGVPEKQRDYMMNFYLHGLMAIITQWLEGGCAEPVEELISVIQRCIRA